MKNKILILSSVLCLGIVVSYVAFGWSEPVGSMPSEYKIPINTSIESQDVTEGKPVVVNLNSDKVDGYNASDLLGATTSSSSNMVVSIASSGTPAGCPMGWIDFGVLSLDAANHSVRHCYKDSSIDGSPYNLDATISNPLIPEESKTITVSFGGSSSTISVTCNSGTLDYSEKQNIVSYTVFNLSNIGLGQDLICNFEANNSYGETSTQKIWPMPPIVSSILFTDRATDICSRYLTYCPWIVANNVYDGYYGKYIIPNRTYLRDLITYDKIESVTTKVLEGYSSVCTWKCFNASGENLGSYSSEFPNGTVSITLESAYLGPDPISICPVQSINIHAKD